LAAEISELFVRAGSRHAAILAVRSFRTGKTIMVRAFCGKPVSILSPISSSILFQNGWENRKKALHGIFKKAKHPLPAILFLMKSMPWRQNGGEDTGSGAIERVASQFFQ